MKLKKIVPVALILLAVLTIGAVSAADDANFDEALAADNVQETLDVSSDDIVSEMSPEDISIDVKDSIAKEDSNSSFVDVYLTEKDGNFVICKGEGEETLELYREDISSSDRVDEDEGYHFGVSIDDVNAFIAENIDEESYFYDVVESGDVLRFVLEYQDDDFAQRAYSVDFDEDTIFFNEAGGIGCFIWNSDDDGPLYVDFDGRVVSVDSLDGMGGSIVVYVNGNEYEWGIDDNYREWSLEDLEITEPGEYDITVKYFGGEDEEETIDEAALDVVEFNNDAFRATVSYNDKRVRFFSPNGSEGTITITVERFDEDADDFEVIEEFNYEIDEEYWDDWMEFPFDELNVPMGDSLIRVVVSDDQYSYAYGGYLAGSVEIYTDNVVGDGIIYADNKGYILEISPKDGFDNGRAEIFVNGLLLFNTKICMPADYNSYFWNLRTLNMTEPGQYDITVIIETEGKQENYDFNFQVVEFENDTFRAMQIYVEDDDQTVLSFFCPDGASGTIEMKLMRWNEEEEMNVPAGEYAFEINSTMYNKWTPIYVFDGRYDYYVESFTVGDAEICVEREDTQGSDDFGFDVNDWGNMYDDNTVAKVMVPFGKTDSNTTFTISGNDEELFSIMLRDLQEREYEWSVQYGGQGCYAYEITFDEVDFFSSLSDMDPVLFNLSVGRSPDRVPYSLYHIEKHEGFARLYMYEALRIDLVEISLLDFDGDEGRPVFNISEDGTFMTVGVPDELNITETAVLEIAYEDNAYAYDLNDFSSTYQYNYLGRVHEIPLSALHPENIKGSAIVNVTLKNEGAVIGQKILFAYLVEEGVMGVTEFEDSINLELHRGEIGHTMYGLDICDGKLMILTIPHYLNVTDGAVQLIADDGTVLYSKSLSEFDDGHIDDGVQSREYWISDNITEFDYSCIPEGVNFTAAFTYENTTLAFAKGVRVGDILYHINTPVEVAKLFKVTVSEGVLCDGEANAIIIESTNDANRQSIVIDIGGGYFAVYINGKKVEDLGRLVRVDNETELDLFRMCSSFEGTPKLYIYLSDLNVTENGEYSIRVTHVAGGSDLTVPVETELFNKNVTLTSNVRVNYQNNTTELFTGYGFDPVLLYLDTYYDDISQTNGTITVVNSKGVEILSKSIRDLTYDNGRCILRYSDFENKDFGDNITVRYGNGNERDGETSLDVLWKDVESDDFTPTVNDNVDDYYGDFVNMNIPALISTGQIIVTIKFKNNHGSNISNMNVTTDFGSQAVYTFNVADIKANYENGDFKLALSDLGFYEVNGDYDVNVQFTADGTETLDVANSTVNVEFSNDILLAVNETSRYSNELAFAAVKVFEPISAYGELYIDGVLYSHKNFEKGQIVFDSSALWAPGNHTAELIVCDSEFGTVLNSTAIEFETLVHTDDVEVELDESVKEGEDVFVTINVPKDSEAIIQIDNGEKVAYALKTGENSINLGVLAYGNHSIAVAYNTTLDDGTPSFYTNCLSLFVGDDGRWLDLPEPLVLENDDTIKMNFGSDAQGNVVVTIDGEVVANQTLVNGTADISMTELISGENRYGKHTYNITYSGDETHDSLSKSGEFDVTYLFRDNIVKEGFPLREYYYIAITLPADAKGSVDLTVEGKKYTSQVIDGQAAFEIPDLSMGEHDVNVSYSGDDKYPANSYSNIINVSYYAAVGDLRDAKRTVSLLLPSNATGNLTVYNDNRAEKLFTQEVANGKVSIDLSKLTVGKYDIRAVYEGDDYDVKDFKTQFDVLPKIYIKQNITIGETGQVFVDLDNAVGHLLILVEGLSPVLMEIEDGKVNYTFDTEGLSKGNHTVSFQYFGNSFDGNVFYAFNNETGYFMPINYNMYLLAKAPQVNMTPGDDWIIIDCGNATGTIEVFVDGVSIGVAKITNGLARIDLSAFKDGDYNITFKYSGDRIYDGFTKYLKVNVAHKVPSITAKDTTVLYTAKGKYSVTVLDADKKPVSGTPVSFVIGGKVYRTANTNAQGVATIVIDKTPGSYQITANALGVSATKKLTVKHLVTLKKVTVKKSAKKLVLTATLSKVNKKYLKNKKVTFKFKGKKYTAKTNKKGVAKVTIKSSVLKKLKVGKKVTYQATYLKDTVKKTVKVKK